MKFLRFVLCILLALFVAKIVCAQAVEEVTLVVSSDGATKEDAVKFALRSAIEQAYGTFVSANTSILNDELVKDEIVTVSSGNVKSYEEIVSETLPNGRFFVTLKATVSLSKLISYAQSKGAECEFAGATFGMQMKLEELNRENISKVFENLALQYKEIIPSCFDYEIKAEPLEDVRVFSSAFMKGYRDQKKLQNMLDSCYCIGIVITAKLNKNSVFIKQLVEQTFRGISVANGEKGVPQSMEIYDGPLRHRYAEVIMGVDKEYFMEGKYAKPVNTGIVNKFLFPKGALTDKDSRSISSIKPIRFGLYSLVRLLNSYYTEAKRSFAIVVNDKDTLNCMNWLTAPRVYKNLNNYKNRGQYTGTYNRALNDEWGESIFQESKYKKSGIYNIPNTLSPYPYIYLYAREGLIGDRLKEAYTFYEGEWKIYFLYPKADIAKLTSFKVVSGNVKF